MKNFNEVDNRMANAALDYMIDLLLKIWNENKDNKELLEWAITPTKNRFGDRDIVNGINVSNAILLDSDNIDKDIYQKLVDLIYTNKQIARLNPVDSGSYLILTLTNPKLKLTEEQKAFALSEAMEMRDTVKYVKDMEDYSKFLDKKGVSEEQKSICLYVKSMFGLPDGLENHASSGDFDIRYWILKNPNWSLDEKKKLVMDFWADSDEYDRTLDGWEWAIVNDEANRKGYTMPIFFDDKDDIYNYTYEELLKFYDNKKTTDEIWNEIQFCALMHKIRPQQMEVETDPDKLEELEYRIYG